MSATLVRINRENNDNLRCWLIGNPAVDARAATPTGGERFSVQEVFQTVQGAGWPYKQFLPTGNLHAEFEGSGTLRFGTPIERFRWKNRLAHPEASQRPFPSTGDVVLRMNTGTDTFEEAIMPAAVLSFAPVNGQGSSLTLNVTARGPYVRPKCTGERATMWVQGPSNQSAILYLFGDKNGGGFTTDATPDVDTLSTTPPSDYRLLIDVESDVGAAFPYEAKFYYRAAGGGSAAGHTSMDTNLVDHLDLLAAALDPDYVTATVVQYQGRQALRLQAAEVGLGGISNTKIRVRLNQFSTGSFIKYDGEAWGNATMRMKLVCGEADLITDILTPI